ncbi:MAG: hypothetical protein ABW060_10505 [Solirubrobacteraceae bacterium]
MLELADGDAVLTFTHEDLLEFHGTSSPAGVAIAYRVLERALPLLSPGAPPQRREIAIATAFGGPGARDAFELATRAMSDGRYKVDRSLRRPDRGPALERFVFRLAYRGREATLLLREGLVSDEFAALAFARERDAAGESRLTVLKAELAERVLAAGDAVEAEGA